MGTGSFFSLFAMCIFVITGIAGVVIVSAMSIKSDGICI